jgi:hypothetical protein
VREFPLNPPFYSWGKEKIKEIIMSNYFVLGFRKIKTAEEYKNKIVGHNHRNRNYKNRVNINTSKSKNNIVLQKLKYISANELIDTANQIIKKENVKTKERNEKIEDEKQKEKLRRGLKKGSAFAYEILVDCSKIPGWQESNYIEYLKEAEKWLKDKFQGQEVISSIIHMDEGKPHLHITFSYFNTDLKRWNQRGLKDKNLTNLNYLLKAFEKEIGSKYGLKKGDNKDIKKQLSVNAKKIFGDKIETYKVKKGLISTQEIKAISVNNINKCLTTYYNKIIKKVNQKMPEIGQTERLKEELLKAKQQHQQEIQELSNIIDKEIQEYNKELQKTLKTIKNVKEKYKKELHEKNMLINQLRNKVNNLEKELETLKPKQKFKGIDF